MVLICGCVMYGTIVLLWPQTLAVSSDLHCTDWAGTDIPQGSEFMPNKAEPCHVCLCDRGYATGCRSVSCSPPDCPDYKQVDGVCCKFVCSSDMEDGRGFARNGTGDGSGDSTAFEGDTFANLGLRLVATTVTCFLVLALLLFMVHRIRQKRILVAMRRYEERRQQQLDDDDQNFYPPSFIGIQCPPYEDLPPPYSPPKPPPPRIEPDEDPPPYEAIEGNNSESNNNASNVDIDPAPLSIPLTESQHVSENDSNRTVREELENVVDDGSGNCQNLGSDMRSSEVIFHRNLVRFITDLSANNRHIDRNALSKTANSSSNRAELSPSNDFNEEDMPQISYCKQGKSNDLTRKQVESNESSFRTEKKRSQLNTGSANKLVSIGIERMSSDDNFTGSLRENVAFTTFGHPISGNSKIHSPISEESKNGENCPEVGLEASNSVINNHGRYSSLPTKVVPPYAQILYVDSDSNRIPTSGHKKSKSCGEKNSFSTFSQSAPENRYTASSQINLNTSPDKKSSWSYVDLHQSGSPGSSICDNRICNRQYSQNQNSTQPSHKESFTEFEDIRPPVSPSNDIYPHQTQKSESIMSGLSVCSETGEKRASQTSETLQNDAVYPDFWNRQSQEHNTRTIPTTAEESFLDSLYCYSNDKSCVLQERQNDKTELVKMANLKPCSAISSPSNRSSRSHSVTGNETVSIVNSDTVKSGCDSNVSQEINSVKVPNHHDRYLDAVGKNTHADYKKRQNDCVRKNNNDQKYSKRFSTGSLPQQKHCRTEQSSKSPVSHRHGNAGGPRVNNRSSPKYQSPGKRELGKGAKQSGPYKQYGFIDDPTILVDFWNRANIVEKKDRNSFKNNVLQSNIPENDINTTSYFSQANWAIPSPTTGGGSDMAHGKRPADVKKSPASLRVHRQKTTGLGAHEISEKPQSPVNVALRHQGARKKGCVSKQEQHRNSFPDSQSHGSVTVPVPLMTQSLGDQNVFLTDTVLKSSKAKRPADDSGVQLDCSHASSYV